MQHAQTLKEENETPDFRISKTVYPSKLKMPLHRHESASLSIIFNGKIREQAEGKDQTFVSSTLLVNPPDRSHAVSFSDRPVQILNVRFYGKFLTRFSSLARVIESSKNCRSENIIRLGNKLVKETQQNDELSAIAIEAIVLELLVEVSRRGKRKSDPASSLWLLKAKEFLHDNFSESVTLKKTADEVGVHPVHLARTFRRRFGCTIGEYVRTLRVEFAKKQMSATRKSLCEIALISGFSDQSHLSKTFKNLCGLTPNEYRKTNCTG
ncbi:MAG: AraC family transcriptional regulator [Pyrinomonadaceae bacterium]